MNEGASTHRDVKIQPALPKDHKISES